MAELDFTIEFNSDLDNPDFEGELLSRAEQRLRALAKGHQDITGASATLRQPAKMETAPLHEATVVVYVRPENIVGKEKQDNPEGALKGALDAVEKQVRKKREKLRESWKQPQNDPVIQEVMELAAADAELDSGEDLPLEE